MKKDKQYNNQKKKDKRINGKRSKGDKVINILFINRCLDWVIVVYDQVSNVS
jgi:hypothetical protein